MAEVTQELVDKVLEAITELVDCDEPWGDKKEKIMELITDNEKVILMEFIGWFDDADERG